mmetsp:Transcript_55107/g.117125  ORF Transcript_55107/g.117125 Transcript_55107/m.117125 type:complete len:89 (-) Transcript_55107:567-833(-)
MRQHCHFKNDKSFANCHGQRSASCYCEFFIPMIDSRAQTELILAISMSALQALSSGSADIENDEFFGKCRGQNVHAIVNASFLWPAFA